MPLNRPLTADELEAVRRLPSPALANAIEIFDLRPRNAGFMDPSIKQLFPELGSIIGYAFTAVIRAKDMPADGVNLSREAYWDYVANARAPRLAVIQDADDPPNWGAFYGEVNTNIHRALGFVGCVTNGAVRDLDEVRALGVPMFASGPCVSHSYIHITAFGGPVRVGGLTVKPGDLLLADMHGVLVIPEEIVPELPEAVARFERYERPIIQFCQSPDFTLEGFKAFMRSHKL